MNQNHNSQHMTTQQQYYQNNMHHYSMNTMNYNHCQSNQHLQTQPQQQQYPQQPMLSSYGMQQRRIQQIQNQLRQTSTASFTSVSSNGSYHHYHHNQLALFVDDHSSRFSNAHHPQYPHFHDNKMEMVNIPRNNHYVPQQQNYHHQSTQNSENTTTTLSTVSNPSYDPIHQNPIHGVVNYQHDEPVSTSTNIKSVIRTKPIEQSKQENVSSASQSLQSWSKYVFISSLSAGSFGEVWKAFDLQNGEDVAIKFIKDLKGMDEAKRVRRRKAFLYEGKMLKQLNGINTSHTLDILGQTRIIKCHEIMDFGINGAALSMEMHGISLFEFLTGCRKKMNLMPISVIRTMSVQILTAINFIHGIGNTLHCDIKPENILFNHSEVKQGKNIELKICDFGNAINFNRTLSTFNIQSEIYRSIEVLFGNKNHISSKIDIWSIGCILFEFYTNSRMIQQNAFNADSNQYIVELWKIFGSFPHSLYNKLYSTNYNNLYECWSMSDNHGTFTDITPPTNNTYQSLKNERIAALKDKMASYRNIKTEDEEFFDLLSCLLDPNPFTRYSSWDALKHPFLTGKSMTTDIQNQKMQYVSCMTDDERNDILIKEWKKYQCNLKLFGDESSSSSSLNHGINNYKQSLLIRVKKDLIE